MSVTAENRNRKTSREGRQFVVFGGSYFSRDLFTYDTIYRSWTKHSECRLGRFKTTAAVVDGNVFVIGGQVQTAATTGWASVTDVIERYNFNLPEGERGWDIVHPMLKKRFSCFSAVNNGEIVVPGGIDETHSILNSCEMFRPDRNEWFSISDMISKRASHGVAVSNGVVLIMGGDDGVKPMRACERFDPRVGRWESIAPMNNPRRWLAATAVNDDAYAMGGELPSDRSSTPLSTLEMYDARQNRWIEKKKMTRKRHGCGACSLNGKIYVVGGVAVQKGHSKIVCYDPDLDKWKHEYETSTKFVYPAVSTFD